MPRVSEHQSEPTRDHRGRFLLAAIVTLAVLARLVVIGPGYGRLDDPDKYLVLARSLAAGQGLALKGRPTAYRPPLYPVLLAPIVAALGDRIAWGVAGLHLALGAGTVLLAALTARRWGMASGRVLVAAAIVAFDPVLVAQARTVMTETLAAFLVTAALAALADPRPRGALLGGLAFGLGTLCRPSLLPVAGLVALVAMIAGPGARTERLRRGAMVAVATVVVLVPWAWRNARVLGEPVWTTTHGGYTLALANNPVYYAEVLDGPPGTVWSGPNQARWFAEVQAETAGLSEPEADRRLRARALRMATTRPRDFARASIARLGRFWGLAPSGSVVPRLLRLATAAWTVPLWIALGLGLLRPELWRWPRVAAPAVVFALSAVHLVFWTDLRMRAPVVPAIALIAAGAGMVPKGGLRRKAVQSPER
jgi:4-amino-4-deoxy-L-arabinose transferase-like glycosyltransferase